MAVNVSPRQFDKDNIGRLVARALQESGLPGGLLKLEITESLFAGDVQRAADTLQELRALGVGISIDDFGTGYSALAHLRRFPIDQLKIDRSFVQNLGANREDAAIAQALIALARSMELAVIAEGVETEAQLCFLRERDCDGIQGYYFSRPLPAGQAGALLRLPHDLGMLADLAAHPTASVAKHASRAASPASLSEGDDKISS